MRSKPAIACLLAAAALAPGCTIVKPVICTFTYPIDVLGAGGSTDDDEGEEYEQIPPPLVCVAAPVVIPLRCIGLAVTGFAFGLASGLASDLNIVLWNFDEPLKNLTQPFLTNMKRPELP